MEINTNYPKTVQKIHKNFFTASDLMVEKAVKCIETTKINRDKLEMLERAGFIGSKEYVEEQTKLENLKNQKEAARIVLDNKTKFPLHKFVTQEQVNEICKKYNLQQGLIEDFNEEKE